MMDQRFERKLETEQAGERLDVFVSQWIPDVTRSRVQTLLAEGMILVDGGAVAALPEGTEIQVKKAPFTADFPVKESAGFLARVRNKLNG